MKTKYRMRLFNFMNREEAGGGGCLFEGRRLFEGGGGWLFCFSNFNLNITLSLFQVNKNCYIVSANLDHLFR